MNVTPNVTTVTATTATQRCQPSQTWQAISISEDVTCREWLGLRRKNLKSKISKLDEKS